MTTLTRADWEQRAQQLKIEGRAFIDGEYRDSVSGDTFDCISPVDGRALAAIASCDGFSSLFLFTSNSIRGN